MSKKLLLGVFAGLLASIGTHASDDLSYSYVQVEYVRLEIDNGPNGDGLGFAGSRVQGVGGSNPLAPTNSTKTLQSAQFSGSSMAFNIGRPASDT